MPALARQTKYAQNRDGMICVLCDVRGQARPASIQVWSHSNKKIVDLPRSRVKIETPDARRWMAISMPRWLMNREALWYAPEPVMNDFCRANSTDIRTPQQIVDDAERSIAQYEVTRANRYRRTPDNHAAIVGGETWGI